MWHNLQNNCDNNDTVHKIDSGLSVYNNNYNHNQSNTQQEFTFPNGFLNKGIPTAIFKQLNH